MASDKQEPRPRTSRRRRLAGAITISFATISLAGIPAATARSDHEKAAPPESSPQIATPGKAATPHAPKPDKVAGGAAPNEATPPKHAKHTEPAPAPSGAETGVSGAGTGLAPQQARHSDASRRHQDGSGTGARGRGKVPSSSGGQGAVSPSASGSGSGSGKTSGAGAQALVKSNKGKGSSEPALEAERRRAKERAGKPTASQVNRPRAKKVEASHSGAGAGEVPAASSEVPSPLPAPAPVATTAAVSSVPAATQSARLSAAPATRAARSPRVKRGAAAHRHSAPPASSTGLRAPAPTLLAAGAATRAASATKPTRRAARRAKPHEASSPLSRTITKIVGVVPTPVRVLIGALLALALALGVRSRLIARRARRLESQRGELLEDVGLLQAALLPVAPARLGPVGTTAAYRPAAGPAAGGDFYDVFALEDGQLAVIVGDVSGHGREALPHTALVRFTLRAYLEAGLSPRGAVQTAGAVLERQLGGSFATVVAATYNPRERVLVYASAGHPPPLVLGGGADQAPLEAITVCSSPPLGVGMATGTRQSVVSIPGAAQICFYTDGVTEARIGTELFGPRRLAETLAEIGPAGNASELLDRVSAQADRRPDDMAACLLSIAGPVAAPRGLVEEIELDRETVVSERAEQLLIACGVEASEAAAVLRSAASTVERTGCVVLELHRADGHARVTLQNDNLTYLQTRHAARQADRMVTL
jgi:serine phosphatase RsbU (regulator of sigma subunit)